MVASAQQEATATNATAAATAAPQKRDVYVTGFGKFGDILENPTTFLAKALADHPNVTEAQVLETSAEGEARGERGRPCIFLHFGLSAMARTFKLEHVGYNVADFRIPDERGYVAKEETIHEGEPDEITTTLPLNEMLETLQKVNPKVLISEDPGRYICNYVYYRSLVWVKQQAANGSPKQDKAQAPAAGAELKEAIKRQVEFYFSPGNLTNDAYLVSQMNSQMYAGNGLLCCVGDCKSAESILTHGWTNGLARACRYVPVEIIINFSKIKQLTDNTDLLIEAIRGSTVCSLNATNDAIKPNIKSERTTIILREIPSATQPADVEAIFEGCGKVVNVRSDVGDTWFVTMNSEAEAVSTLLALRSKSFNGAPIKARLKSENVLKSFYPAQPAENVIAPAVGTPYGGRGYYASANMGYYDNYGVQYNTVNPRANQQHQAHPHHQYNNGGENSRYAGNNQRGGHSANGGRGGQGFRQNRANGANSSPAAHQQQHQQKDARAKSGSFEQRGAGSSRKSKDKRGAKPAAQQQQQANGNANAKRPVAASTPAERQPILNAANFPPLPNAGEKGEVLTVITRSYAHEDIMEIVKNMDDNDCMLPEGKMDYDAHPAALTSVAHPDLLRNQRTYSIEQARDAMRQGRPIRSDSVGSIDYESMMYGEDYTKEARELRKQKAESTAAATDAAKPTAVATPAAAAKPTAAAKTPAPAAVSAAPVKVVGYAAAVINGTPAPAPTATDAKKKQPAPKAAAKTVAAGKDDKKPVASKKVASKAPESTSETATAAAGADESLPKAGAWGGRNFLDVVKSDPPAAPVKPAAVSGRSKSAAPVSESS
ncbi:hypothetical protein BBJ28_00001223 [Nothophytophthora sp. Chile5]|nr:hypothetical protein BBJ28_00001223 [Nothophytophthora sp. Chile5]